MNQKDCALERKRRCSARWTKRVADFFGMTRFCESKWNTPPLGSYEAPRDFDSQSTHNFLRCGNISHRRHAQFSNNARLTWCVGRGLLVWYFPPIECIVGYLGRNYFFPPQISVNLPREVVVPRVKYQINAHGIPDSKHSLLFLIGSILGPFTLL